MPGANVRCPVPLRRRNWPSDADVTSKQAVAFVKTTGIVLESARGTVPNLAEAIAGRPVKGSYWADAKGNEIYLCTRALRKRPDILVCRLVNGKITYVHQRLWPAIVRLSDSLDHARLAAIREVHTAQGKHAVETTAFPDWVPPDIRRAAAALTQREALSKMSAWVDVIGATVI